MRFVDSHLHFDVLLDRVPGVVDWFLAHDAHPVSWAYAYEGVRCVADISRYFEAQRDAFAAVRDRIDVRYLVGVHPRNLPEDLLPENVAELLEPWVGEPGCVGLGEIGIDTDDPREAEIFQAQLEWSAQLPETHLVGVHTPRANKGQVTRQILSLVQAHAPRPQRVLIDHCTEETLPEVLRVAGFAGISLSPNKSTVEEAVTLLQTHRADAARIMCNTDSAIDLYEPLLRLSACHELEPAFLEQVMCDTACRAFNF